MLKDNSEKPKRCGKYTFRLIGKNHTFYKGVTLVQFKPDTKTKKIHKKSLAPTLNNDKKHFTPTFLNPCFDLIEDEKFEQEYKKRLKQNTEQKQTSLMLVAKPRSKAKYCGVCKQQYEDYLEHINGEKHHEMCQKSIWQKQFMTEAQKFLSQFEQQFSQNLSGKKSVDNTCEINCMQTQEEILSSVSRN